MPKEISGIEKANQVFNHTINQLMQSQLFSSEEKAFVVLKACLLALRDRIGRDEAVHLGGQLSPILRGFYYEAWNPHRNTSKSRTSQEFIEDVRDRFLGHDEIDLVRAVPVTLGLILEMIDEGEAMQVLKNLPKGIQNLCID